MPAYVEVYNLFSNLIPQDGLARYEANRQRQAIIPDLRILLPLDNLLTSVLHEVKVISVSQTWYKPTWEERAVDRRAAQLHEEYVVKARNVDTNFCNTAPGRVGPVAAKLASFETVRGLVFGALGEASEPIHQIQGSLANLRVSVALPQRRRRGPTQSVEGERALVIAQLRRKHSIASVRTQCFSLLGRLEQLGPGL